MCKGQRGTHSTEEARGERTRYQLESDVIGMGACITAFQAKRDELLAEVETLRAQRDALVEAAERAQGLLGTSDVRFMVRATMGEAAWWDNVDRKLRTALAATKAT